jgi:hypothetical protein
MCRREEHTEAVLAKVRLRRRAAAWVEVSGAGVVLVLLDVLLSVMSVLAYIVNTYRVPYALKVVSYAHLVAVSVSLYLFIYLFIIYLFVYLLRGPARPLGISSRPNRPHGIM